jgi:hypothetical protein
MRGHLGPACNAVGYVDRQVWGVNHLYTQPIWTLEGLFYNRSRILPLSFSSSSSSSPKRHNCNAFDDLS